MTPNDEEHAAGPNERGWVYDGPDFLRPVDADPTDAPDEPAATDPGPVDGDEGAGLEPVDGDTTANAGLLDDSAPTVDDSDASASPEDAAETVNAELVDDSAPAVDDSDASTLPEDVADLRAIVHSLAEQLELTTRRLNAVIEAAADEDDEEEEEATPPEPGAGHKPGPREEKKPPAPPLILKLSGDEYERELALLSNWVRYLLAPHYLTEVSSQAPWCPKWWEHPQAVARLHALWIAWQELTTPEAGGWTGPSVWHLNHLDPCIAALRDPSGPFAGCMIKPEYAQHIVPEQPYAEPLPAAGIEEH
ncbi:DUF4913 domain-containing protein [Streptomyces sp. NPDC001633]|uniref:DUF4913 domain-containing protein n=1 Tax=Streptomyces sp. NPDC001633 TaxID=3364595 RepID=UPI0036AEED29